MNIKNRRYTGSKQKLMDWIKSVMLEECKNCSSFFDVFGGTGVVTSECLDLYDELFLNDFLYSNEIIYRGFMDNSLGYDKNKLSKIKETYSKLVPNQISDNYVSNNYGDKYFSHNDAKIIGYIREDIEQKKSKRIINKKEYAILVASLLYSFDRISNTVGHYEAYIKGHDIPDRFVFELIEPINHKKKIHIYREDSNALARKLNADIAFVDPPYNSRQYSRFYHVMETIVKWDKPELIGVARKPKEENMSDYCRNSAPVVFKDLVNNLNVKYIVVTYNNTYNSKSSSSKNKITLEQITEILKSRGSVKIFEHKHNAFNAGKTDLKDHKEFLFICEVANG